MSLLDNCIVQRFPSVGPLLRLCSTADADLRRRRTAVGPDLLIVLVQLSRSDSGQAAGRTGIGDVVAFKD